MTRHVVVTGGAGFIGSNIVDAYLARGWYVTIIDNLSSVALRYANVYGPRQNAHGEAGVVAIFSAKLLDKQQATINGSGEQTRDFVYIDDVVAANMAASDAEWQGEYNVGTGMETTVN